MKRQSTGSRHLIPQSRPSKQITLQQLLDRDSRQKTIQPRKIRQNVIPQLKLDQKKQQVDKNLRINNLQKQFEELKNKIKHVENKNERILTKLKSFKDDSRQKSRSRANKSINKDQSSQLSQHQIVIQNPNVAPQKGSNTVSFGKEDRLDVRDPYFIQYPRRESTGSHYNLLIEENTALKESVQFLKMQVEKYERSMASRNQMYEQKETFYKQMMDSKDQQISKLKQPKNRSDMRKLVEYINTTERLNSQTRMMLQKRVKELDQRLGRALKLIKLCERTIKEQRGSKSLRHNKTHSEKDTLQFFTLKQKQLENIIDELEKDQRKLRNQNSDATKEAEEARAKLDSLKDSHEQELRELRSKYTARMSTIEKKYTDQIRLNTEEINQLKRERDDVVDQLTDEKLLLTKIKKQLAQTEEKIKKNESKLNLQLQNARNEVVMLKENLSRVEQQRDSLQFDIDRLRVGKSMKDSDLLSTDRNEKLQLGNQIKTLRLEIEKLELQLTNLKRQNWQVNLKLKKKEEFKVELQQVYKEKLQEETKSSTVAREEKRKAQLQLNQLKAQMANDTVQRERIAREIVQEVELLAVLQGEGDSTYKSLLDIYKDHPMDIPLEIIRIAADNKRMQAQDKQRITKLIENKKLQFSGNRRFEIQAVEQLVQMAGCLTTELRMKEQASQQLQTKNRWEKQLLEQQVSKLKKSNEQLKRQRQKDDMEKKQRKSEVAQVKQSMEEQQKERYAELRNIVLKAETEKKELEKRLKMTQFQMDEFKQSIEEQLRRKERSEADKERMMDELHQRLIEKEQRLKEYEIEVRDMKQDSLKKKRDYMSELRKIEYDLNEKISKLEMEIDQKNSQLLYKDEQIIALTTENGSISASLTTQKSKLNKQLTQNEKTLRDSISKKDEQVKSKMTEIMQLTGTHQELTRKQIQLQHQLRQKQSQQQIVKQSLEREKEKYTNLERMRLNEKAEYQQKLKLKKQNEDLLTKRLQLKNSESTRYHQEVKDLRQRLEELPTIKQDYEKLQDKMIQKQSHLIEYQQKVRILQEQNRSLTEKLTEQNQSHKLSMMKLEGHNKNIEDQLTASERENETLKTNLHQKQAELQRTLRQLEASQKQLKDKEGQLDQLKSLHEKAAGNNEGLRKEAEQYSAMLKVAEQKQMQINELRKKIQQLIADNSQLQQKLRVSNESMSKLQNKSAKHQAELQTAMQREKVAYQQRLQDQKKTYEIQHAKQIQSHTHEKDQLIEEYTQTEVQLKSKIILLENTIKNLNAQIELSRGQLNILANNHQCQEQLKSAKSQLHKLKLQKIQIDNLVNTLQHANRQLKQQQKHKHHTQSQMNVPPYNIPAFQNVVDRVEQDTANFFSIGEDQPVTKRKQQNGNMEAHLKEFFTQIRIEIEKVLNQEEISVQIFEILPGQMADEFQQLINAVHGRILELNEKAQQQELSFIYIDQQEEVYFGDSLIEEFPDLGTVTADPKELLELKSKVSEQQRAIHNLTSEKEQHQNTINQLTQQKQQAEEQNEARFITQLGVLKKQLKQFKDRIDALDTLLSATKKTLFKVLQITFSDNPKLEQDLAEAMNYYMSIVKLPEKEKQQLNSYFQKYSQRSKSASKRSWFS